ncbi:Type IV secretory pathway VirD4 protein-like protein (plasmid) [Halalkalicoccus jeotgali B3]|uniref:Type IV secretory pathway VirD4 protein-like protein n=1 Tax=Halalkalicoccus jeotgali (strain DSM 18796 / CECT 7217 / JCM 14584 / KCTC 4019 / B3) TaxID=795797 RepID=D8JC58_HALJB|nr:type IV secretion system DNA-binding domain-containing protein [Halalkalicoccus jeotgali]ADJ16965.1 Type IV secretory pathway VirD4 protein-like protein [Halalkalicoccus jeotgali B3]ADJ16996.1 Type IV secretory pathway VirD4 protein-like protein [Halalkalicoccus jeotgali B3]
MVLGTLLNLTAVAAMLAYVSKVKGFSPVGPYDAWRVITAPLRDVNRALTPLAAIIGWFVALWLADVTGAIWLTVALFFGIGGALLYETIRVGIPTAIGATIGLVSGLTSDVRPDRDNFSLPLTIYESQADDVSEWTDGAMHVPRRSLLTLGASGAGKSETLKHFVDQLQADPSEPVVVFDMKRDYQAFLKERGASMIRLSSQGSSTEIGSPIAWNIFAEMETEADADEIARSLFPKGRDQNNFFDTAGRQLFAANLKYLKRELDNPTNADLVRYWQRASPKKMHENLSRDGHEDLTAAASAIDPETAKQPGECSQAPSNKFKTSLWVTSRSPATSRFVSTWRIRKAVFSYSTTRRARARRSRPCSAT